MPPVDNTPPTNAGSFELLYSSKAYNKIPISEYKSKSTGLTVVIADVEGPIVNGFFCVVTEAFDDDGLPHTLEHLIFLGSEDFPYKGVLDLLANRCLASGTNAWTDIDHTCYTMETAGSEGFLQLMPIFLEHILYPVLTDEGFITEVHHITPEGEDAGVVYCEMQGRENSGESRLHYTLSKLMYPGECGYSSETGGIMKNLRESTSNLKVRNYHKEFYRPENLKIVITGRVEPQLVFKSLKKLEEKIISKGDLPTFQRPWQSPIPPIPESKEIELCYPADDENHGIFCLGWRGPSAVHDQFTVTACSLLLKFLCDTAVAPLQKEFVEIDDPYASKVSYNMYENSTVCLYIMWEDVPVSKLDQIKGKVDALLNNIIKTENFDMKRMESVINKHKLESLSNLENSPHNTIAFLIISHMLYGNTQSDLEERVNPLVSFEKLKSQPKSYWLDLIKKYLIDGKFIGIRCKPSKEEQNKMSVDEKLRVENQIKQLGEDGLKNKAEELEKAIEYNEREPPLDMLTSLPVPSVETNNFHKIIRYKCEDNQVGLNLSDAPVYTFFDDINSNFVYIFALLDTSQIPSNLRVYLPLLLESLFELPIRKNNQTIPYEDVITSLNDDIVNYSAHLGITKRGLFKCGPFSQHACIIIQVEDSKFKNGLNWLKDIMYNTVFNTERLKVIAAKINNAAAQAKRSGSDMVSYAMKTLCFVEDSNIHNNGLMIQNKFLTSLMEQFDKNEKVEETIEIFNNIRNQITDSKNLVLYLAGNLKNIDDPVQLLKTTFSDTMEKADGLKATPEYKLLKSHQEGALSGCIIGMGCLESSFFIQSTKGISEYLNPDLPALLLFLQYLIQAEGPLWKQIRGKGFAYGYTMLAHVKEGLLYLILTKATNIVAAYRETKQIVAKQLELKEWDETLLEAARSSLLFEIIEEETTIGSVVNLSLSSYCGGLDYTFNRNLLKQIEKVTIEDLNKVGVKYVASLFDAKCVKTAIVTDPTKANEIAAGFKESGLDLTVFPSLEESFLSVKEL